MAIGLGVVLIVVAVAACLWLGIDARSQIRVLRGELDQTQGQLNDTRGELDRVQRELSDLKAAAEVVPAVPPLPRSRARGSLDDLREQLRASHREESPPESDE